jgi:hypothetical protein
MKKEEKKQVSHIEDWKKEASTSLSILIQSYNLVATGESFNTWQDVTDYYVYK